MKRYIIVFLLGAFSMHLFQFKMCNKVDDSYLVNALKDSRDTVKVLRNNLGESLASRKALVFQNLDLFNDLKDVNDQFKKLNKARKRFVKPVAMINHVPSYVFKTDKSDIRFIPSKGVQFDSINIAYDDGYIDYDISVLLTADNVSLKGSAVEIVVNDSLSYAFEKKRRGFLGFGGRRYDVKAFSQNPYVVHNDLNGLLLDVKDKRFHFVFSAGCYYDGNRFSKSVGVGFAYSIFSF